MWATSATDILSVESAKVHLWIEADDSDHDAKIKVSIEGAVGYIQKVTGIQFLPLTATVHASMQHPTGPILLGRGDVRSDYQISDPAEDDDYDHRPIVKYWTPEQELREEPAGAVDTADLGRIEMGELPDQTLIWPPSGGWPDTHFGSFLRVTATLGFDFDDENHAGLKQAIVLMTREFYEAPQRLESSFAVMALIGPWQRYG